MKDQDDELVLAYRTGVRDAIKYMNDVHETEEDPLIWEKVLEHGERKMSVGRTLKDELRKS